MSSFQDLYAHAAADRGRAMQFLAIQDIRLKAIKELTDAGVYQEQEDADSMTDEERANRRAEAAYAYGLHSILDSRKLPDQDGSEVYAIAVQDTSTKPYSLALCIQTKLEDLRVNGAETNSANGSPTMNIIVSNSKRDETIDPLKTALETLRVAYPAWRITVEIRGEEAEIRAAVADALRSIIQKTQQDQSEENMQALASAILASPLVFPAQRPQNLKVTPGGEEHLQFGKAKAQDGKSYFLAFTDRAHLFQWRQFGSVELYLKDYAPLILNSQDNGLILDPYVGSSMCITREMLQKLLERYEMVNNMLQTLADMEKGVVSAEPEEAPKKYTPQKPKVNDWWNKK